jgi:5'-3' exonuclease
MVNDRPIIIIDGMNLYHRGYSKFFKFESPTGLATGGIFGFINSLLKYRNKFDSSNIIVCWDSRNNKRKKIDADYKKDRRKDWDADRVVRLFAPLKVLKKILYYSGIVQLYKKGYEADDIIWMMKKCFKKDLIIVTADKDMLQLVNDKRNVIVLRPGDDFVFNEKDVHDKFGVYPKWMPYFLAMTGDRSDRVSGVKNIGTVRAKKIMNDAKIINKKYFIRIFDEEQYKDFAKSFRLIRLGHSINVDYDYKFKNKMVEEQVKAHFDELNIKRFKPIQLKQLSNRKIKQKIRSYYECSKKNLSS